MQGYLLIAMLIIVKSLNWITTITTTSAAAAVATNASAAAFVFLLLNKSSTHPTYPRTSIIPPQSDDHNHNQLLPICTTSRRITNHTTNNNIKAGLIDESFRWKKFFHVYIDEAYDDNERNLIDTAMFTLWQVIPCIRFGYWPRRSKPSGDYVHIVKGTDNGCHSFIGRQSGRQNMQLQSPGCMSVGTIMHELLHALGLEHEHERSDRDEFITIHYGNIEEGREDNFERQVGNRVSSFGVPYDYKSIMHYYSFAFSRNGKPTITLKNGDTIPYLTELQESDKLKLKRMYRC